MEAIEKNFGGGEPSRIRTCDPLIRKTTSGMEA